MNLLTFFNELEELQGVPLPVPSDFLGVYSHAMQYFRLWQSEGIPSKARAEYLFQIHLVGYTLKELAEMTGRAPQSIHRSFLPLMSEEAKTLIRHRRKTWGTLFRFYKYVYLADTRGGFTYLHETYPERSMAYLRQSYKQAGGKLLFTIEKELANERKTRILQLRQQNYPVKVIAKMFDMSISHVYSILQGAEELGEEWLTDTKQECLSL